MLKIKDNAEDQFKAERKRFLAKQKPKPVLADRIKKRNQKALSDRRPKFFSEDDCI